jgi:hypothetical protein
MKRIFILTPVLTLTCAHDIAADVKDNFTRPKTLSDKRIEGPNLTRKVLGRRGFVWDFKTISGWALS